MQETRGWDPRSGRSLGEGNGNPLLYSCLGNPMHGQRTLAGHSPWGHKESNTTQRRNNCNTRSHASFQPSPPPYAFLHCACTHSILSFKTLPQGLLWWPSSEDSTLPMQGAQVQLLVGDWIPQATTHSQCRGPRFNSWWGTTSHRPQLKVPAATGKVPHAQLRLSAATKVNKDSFNKCK